MVEAVSAFKSYELLIIAKQRRNGRYVTRLRDVKGVEYEVQGANFYRQTGRNGMARFEAKVRVIGGGVTQLYYARKVKFIEAPSDDPQALRRHKQIAAAVQLVVDENVCDELLAQGFTLVAEMASEIYEGRTVYAFLKNKRLLAALQRYDAATYYSV